MNRTEFMKKLELLLLDITKEERDEALRFYENYFEDAGLWNEHNIIEELVSPENVATMIKADLGIANLDFGSYTERGYRDERFVHMDSPARYETENESGSQENSTPYEENPSYQQVGISLMERFLRWMKQLSPVQLILMILLFLIFIIPTVVPIFGSLIATVFSLVIAAVSVGFALLVASGAIAISGATVVGTGVLLVFSTPAAGVATIGAGLILLALGLIATYGTFKICKYIYPRMFRFFIDFCKLPFKKRGEAS